MLKILVVGTSMLTALTSAASAQNLTSSSPGFHYFHKSGASMDDHNGDLVACAVATRGLINGSDAMTGIAAATGGGLVGALVGGIIDGNENRQGAAANTENCMALLGWSVIGLSHEEGLALEAFDSDPPALRAALAAYVEAPEPHGVILRGPFANELAEGDFVTGPAGDLEEVSLSVRAAADLTEAAVDAAGPLKAPKRPKGIKAVKPHKAIKAGALSTLPAAGAQLAFSMVGSRANLALTSVVLQRLADDGSEVVHDGKPATATLGGSLTPKFRKSELGADRRYDFVVELTPGIWKLATINNSAYAVDLCFAAPAFVINDAETLFLGEMATPDRGGYPLDQTNLDLARDILADAPELAERVKAAALTNGFASDCFGSYAYAYDQPGAPNLNQP